MTPTSAAFDRLGTALELAQRQTARGWELRIVTSLARLHLSRDARQEAYDVLAPVYTTFSEGHTSVDLVAARQLLERARA